MRQGQRNGLRRYLEEKGIKILAKSVYKTLMANGYGRHEILAFATEVIAHLTRKTDEDGGE